MAKPATPTQPTIEDQINEFVFTTALTSKDAWIRERWAQLRHLVEAMHRTEIKSIRGE